MVRRSDLLATEEVPLRDINAVMALYITLRWAEYRVTLCP